MKECPECLACHDDDLELCPEDRTTLEPSLEGIPIIDGKYRLERRLGQGAMGVIYRVRHLRLHRDFALKLLRPRAAGEESFAALFQNEAEALGALKHPHIVDVTDFGVAARGTGLPYLVMEYLEGPSLKAVCTDEGPLPFARALPLLRAIAEGIDHAHAHGVLHRDLKPGNVLLPRSEESPAGVKILDFGLARFMDPPGSEAASAPQGLEHEPAPEPLLSDPGLADTVAVTRAVSPRGSPAASPSGGSVASGTGGTPPYMAPELWRGLPATRATDIYAFGVLVYEVLAGRPPFQGPLAEIARGHLAKTPPPPSAMLEPLPKELDAPVLQALEKEPARRPASASTLIEGLCSGWEAAETRAWRTREIPRRLRLSLLLGPALAGLCIPLWRTAPLQALEHWTADARMASLTLRPPDPRILLLSVDETDVASDKRLLGERGDEFGQRLGRVFDAGARAVAIDFLLHERWSRSRDFSQLVLRHADALTLAVFSAPDGATIGTECLNGITVAALGPERAAGLFGFVNLEQDPDGVTRRGRTSYLDRTGSQRETWAARAARTLSPATGGGPHDATPEFRIDTAVERRAFRTASWNDLPRLLDEQPSLFRERLVLVGGDLTPTGEDDHRISGRRPGRPQAVSGIVLQALIVNTRLSPRPPRAAGTLAGVLTGAVAGSAVLIGALCLRRWLVSFAIFAGLALLYTLASFVAFATNKLLLPIAGPLLVAIVALGTGYAVRRRLAPFLQPVLE